MFGKAGRAETATDPAPLEMFETTIQFKPREQWRAGHDAGQAGRGARPHRARCPGLSNIWVPPIRNRIDMLATGIKSPVGVKVAGTDLAEIDRIAGEIERVVKDVPGVTSALAERLTGGRYIDVDIDRDAAARYGLNIADVQIDRRVGDRRRERRRDRRRAAALPDQRALSARDARLAREAAATCRSSPSAARRFVLGDVARCRDHRRPADAARARTRGCRAGSTSTSAAATCARRCATCSGRSPRR